MIERVIDAHYTAEKTGTAEPCADPVVSVSVELEKEFILESDEELSSIDTAELYAGSIAIKGTDRYKWDGTQWVADGSIIPSGTLSITANGTHDVARYASANVAVPAYIPDDQFTMSLTLQISKVIDGVRYIPYCSPMFHLETTHGVIGLNIGQENKFPCANEDGSAVTHTFKVPYSSTPMLFHIGNSNASDRDPSHLPDMDVSKYSLSGTIANIRYLTKYIYQQSNTPNYFLLFLGYNSFVSSGKNLTIAYTD